MKKWALLILLFLPSLCFAAPDTIQSTVCFQDALGNCLANGSITFQLSQPAMITSGGGQVAPAFVSVTLDATGKIPAGTTLWGNDQLTPSGTSYMVVIHSSAGTAVAGPFTWVVSGSSPIDLSQEVPTSSGVSYPSVCVPSLPCTMPTLNNVVTPQTYGAKCDGVTDDSTALQNAINAALAQTSGVPTVIFVPPGAACVTSQTLQIEANGPTVVPTLRITGAWAGYAAGTGSGITYTGTGPMFLVQNSNGPSTPLTVNISIDHLHLRATSASAIVSATRIYGPMYITNNFFDGGATAIDGVDANTFSGVQWNIKDNLFSGFTGNAIYLNGNGGEVNVLGNQIFYSGVSLYMSNAIANVSDNDFQRENVAIEVANDINAGWGRYDISGNTINATDNFSGVESTSTRCLLVKSTNNAFPFYVQGTYSGNWCSVGSTTAGLANYAVEMATASNNSTYGVGQNWTFTGANLFAGMVTSAIYNDDTRNSVSLVGQESVSNLNQNSVSSIPLTSGAGTFALTVEGSGITTPTLNTSNSGTFTNTQMNEYVQSLIGGATTLGEYQAGQGLSNYATDAVAGAVAVPLGATVHNIDAVAGYANSSCNASSRTVCNAVGGYFQGRTLASNGAAWGINPYVFDATGNTGTSLTGSEIDVGINGSPAYVRGLVMQNLGSGTMPTDSKGIEITAGSGPKWEYGFTIERASTVADGSIFDGLLSTNPTSSQALDFKGYDSGGTLHEAKVYADQDGNLTISPFSLVEGSAPTIPGTGLDVCYGDSTAHGMKCSYNNGSFLSVPQVIASGTATLTSGAVTTNTCQTAVTVTATGAATTDSIEWAYATAPGTADALMHVSPYVTSGNVNFTRCNATSASETGTAIVINWRVVR